MKKMLLVGRSESGKTTLTQALKGKKVSYHKTQYINYHDVIIDTPGEYAENRNLSQALAPYSYGRMWSDCSSVPRNPILSFHPT